MGLNKELIENNYLIVPNFLEKLDAINYANQFKTFCEKWNVDGDHQVLESSSYRNYLPFFELLIEKTHEVVSIVGEHLIPTYAYSRVYRNKNVLKKHTDHKECEISLTVNLDYDIPWDIWIVTPQNEEKCVRLNQGDAMVYLGYDAIHWREEFLGNYCCQMFLHYIRSRGKFSPYYSELSKL